MKLALIDNEKKSLSVLRKFIEMTGEPAEVLGEAYSVECGVEMINQLRPQAIFLDIEMNDGNAFDLLERLTNVKPHVVFVTAFDHYAVKAFRCNAVDYLEKPVELDQLSEALQRLRKCVESDKEPEYDLSSLAIQSMKGKLAIPTRNGLSYIETKKILYVKADGSYSQIFLENEPNTHLVSRRIQKVGEALEKHGFVRLHRSFIVNLSKIKEVSKTDGGFVRLENGLKIPFSKHYKRSALQIIQALTTSL